MKEEYVTYEQAVKLKELGFDERTTYEYSEIVEGSGREEWDEDEQRMMFIEDINYYPKLRLDQAQKWLRDKGIHISVNPYMGYDVDVDGALYNEYPSWSFELMDVASADFMDDAGGNHTSYELALSAGIDAALELLTDKKRMENE